MGKYRFEDLSQDTLRKLVESLEQCEIPIFLYDDDQMIFTNSAWEKQSTQISRKLENGTDIKDVMLEEISELYPKLDKDQLANLTQDFLNTVFETGGSYEFDGPDGRFYRALYYPDNHKVLGLSLDKTEIRDSRNKARMAQKSLEATLDGLHHGVMIIDETGHVSYANEAIRGFAEETGVTIEKGIHYSKIRENVPHQDPKTTQNPKGDFEYVIKGDTGRSFMVRRRFLKNIGILISTVEITELEEQRAKTKRFSDILERSLEGMPHGVLLYDQVGTVHMFNSVIQQIMEPMNVNVEKGMNYADVTSQIPNKFQEELLGKDPGAPFELVQKNMDGKSYLIEGRPIDGVGFLITTVEITQLQEAMEAAKSADIAKTSFLANMSHEIRTPMNGVLGMAQVLEQTAVSEHQQKCISIIKESSELLLRIINDILDISKLDAEKVEIEEAPFDLDEVINSAVAIVKPKLEEKRGLEIILDVNGRPNHDYIGDAGRIRQILINLLGNGVKFTDKGHVKLTARISETGSDHDHIHFEVEDTGIGIAPEKISQIFERFEQSDMSTTREYGGTGLGLSISRKLAVLMGGELSLCTERGQGACFKFSITLRRQSKTDTPVQRNIRAFKDLPILVIDDNKINHMVLSHQLEPLKVKTFCVDSAEKGLEILRKMAAKKFKFPLVICDYQMPEKTGLEFVKELKSDPAIANTPVIIISSADIVSRRKEFIDLNVKYVLEKPCSKKEIVAAVSEELSRFNSRVTLRRKSNFPGIKPIINRPEGQTKRILIADDDTVNRDVFKGFMNLLGHDYVIVENGLEAVKAFADQSFDFVLMDISMPVLGGMEATIKIREFEKLNQRHSTPHCGDGPRAKR